jgi:hypothetical protein
MAPLKIEVKESRYYESIDDMSRPIGVFQKPPNVREIKRKNIVTNPTANTVSKFQKGLGLELWLPEDMDFPCIDFFTYNQPDCLRIV